MESPMGILKNIQDDSMTIVTNKRILRFEPKTSRGKDQLYFSPAFQGSMKEILSFSEEETAQCFSYSPFPKNLAEPYTLALKTSKRIIYLDIMNPVNPDIQDYEFNESPKLSVPTVEMNMILTSFHLAFLDLDTLYIVNRVNGKESYQQRVNLSPHEEILGLCCDHEKNTYWLYTTDSLHELVVNNETREASLVFLEKGDFEKALECANTAKVRNTVLVGYAEFLMEHEEYERAATLYAETLKSVEEVALKFIELNQKDVLRLYLWKKLRSYKSTMKIQKSLLVNWLLELMLAKLNSLDEKERLELFPENVMQQRQQVQREFSTLLNQYKDEINREAAYNLANNYGKEEQLLQIATVMKDQSYIMHYWVQRENYEKALETLNEGVSQETLIQHATALLTHRPNETVSIWERQTDLDVHALIPSLLSYNQRSHVPVEENAAIRYLRYVTGVLGCVDPSIHNTLFCIYACHSSSNESYLMNYIEQQGNHPLYDMDLGIRLCLQFNCRRSAVKILVLMKLYSQGVELALEADDCELAATIANIPEEDVVLKKTLWQTIAKYMFSKKSGIKETLRFLENSEVLQLPELIRLLPEDIKLDDLSDNVCDELDHCMKRIEQLDFEIGQASEVAHEIQTNAENMRNRYIVLEPNESCWHCNQPLFSEPFVLFPCQHAFHRSCMLEKTYKLASEKNILKECQLCGPSYAVRLINEPFSTDF